MERMIIVANGRWRKKQRHYGSKYDKYSDMNDCLDNKYNNNNGYKAINRNYSVNNNYNNNINSI